MEEGNIFDDLKMHNQSSESSNFNSTTTVQQLDKLKEKSVDEKTITISIEDL